MPCDQTVPAFRCVLAFIHNVINVIVIDHFASLAALLVALSSHPSNMQRF